MAMPQLKVRSISSRATPLAAVSADAAGPRRRLGERLDGVAQAVARGDVDPGRFIGASDGRYGVLFASCSMKANWRRRYLIQDALQCACPPTLCTC